MKSLHLAPSIPQRLARVRGSALPVARPKRGKLHMLYGYGQLYQPPQPSTEVRDGHNWGIAFSLQGKSLLGCLLGFRKCGTAEKNWKVHRVSLIAVEGMERKRRDPGQGPPCLVIENRCLFFKISG